MSNANRDCFKKGWFTEASKMWPGQAASFEYSAVLEETRTDFQDLMVLQTTHFGKMLVLDGVVQATERDECAYQELMAHLAMCAHADGALHEAEGALCSAVLTIHCCSTRPAHRGLSTVRRICTARPQVRPRRGRRRRRRGARGAQARLRGGGHAVRDRRRRGGGGQEAHVVHVRLPR